MENINIPHTFQDKSKYLKGLLILTKRDNNISEDETSILMEAGKKLGFDREFYEDAIHHLLQNEHIHEEQIVFSNKDFAKEFLKDGLKLVYGILNPHGEYDLLKKIAIDNGLDAALLQQLFMELNIKN